MPMPQEQANSTQTVTPPSKTSGDSDEKSTQMVPIEEVEKKLRGQGKLVKKLEEQIAALEAEKADREKTAAERQQKELEEQGKHKELYLKEAEAKKSIEEKYKALVERETKRLEALTASIEKRVAALPKEYRDLVPPGLDPDATAEQVSKLEALAAQRDGKSGGYTGATRPGNQGSTDPAEILRRQHEINKLHMLGKKVMAK